MKHFNTYNVISICLCILGSLAIIGSIITVALDKDERWEIVLPLLISGVIAFIGGLYIKIITLENKDNKKDK